MKKIAQFLLLVSFASYAHDNSKLIEVAKSCASSCYGQDCSTQYCTPGPQGEPGPRGKRGPRGERGHRGDTGPTGAIGTAGTTGATGATGVTGAASGAGLNEVLLTAAMLAGCGEGPLFPTINVVFTGAGGCFSVPVWPMIYFGPGEVGNGGWGPFNVPIDLDNTKPVTAVVHILVPSSTAPNGNANIEVDMAYLANDEIGGGFSDTETSGDFAVISPSSDPSNTNVTQITVPVSLDPTLLVPGDWAFISVTRIPATTNEFTANIFLSTISIQYSRLSS